MLLSSATKILGPVIENGAAGEPIGSEDADPEDESVGGVVCRAGGEALEGSKADTEVELGRGLLQWFVGDDNKSGTFFSVSGLNAGGL